MGGSYHAPWSGTISFQTIIKSYIKLQDKVVAAVKAVADKSDEATPGRFLLLQFQMSQVTQVGQSISNIVAQVMKVINNAVSNQRSQ